MPTKKENPGCKRVKFKSTNHVSAISDDGSFHTFNLQQNRIHFDCQPLSFLKSAHFLTFLLILLSFCSISAEASAIDDLYRSRARRSVQTDETRPDTICNQGGSHECVCNRSMGNLDDRLLICDMLLEEKQLAAVSLIMRNINLDVKLHTNEPYQQYFRRRIANIVSQYCEHKANECPGAILSLNKNNVIILRVNYLERQRTEVQLVVAKESMPKKLTETTLIDSKKVKDILVGQLAPLSRVLGGVQIERLMLVDIDRRKVAAQNRGLIKLLVIIGISMLICYTIACVKVFRDTMEKRRAKKNDAMLAEKNKRNYGSCTDKLLSTCEAPNGKVKSKSITSRASANSSSKDRRTSSNDQRSTTHSSKRSNNNNEDINSITIDINRQDISQPETSPASGATDTRSFQRMFACDLSQLPAETSDLLDDQDAVFLEDETYDTQPSPRQPSTTYNYTENAEIHNTSMDSTPNVNRRPPIVPIVIASGSQFSIDKVVPPTDTSPEISVDRPDYVHQDSTDSTGIDKYFQPLKSPLLSAISEAPFDRPLSRRGSRDSTPEKGHEEFDDTLSTESLQPLGDKSESPQNNQQPPPEITFEQSSSDESEDETNEVYHQLKEEDEESKLRHDAKPEPAEPQRLKEELNKEEISAGSDDELLNENRMLERHAYERLEESPLPSPSIYNNNNSVANNLKTRSMEDAANTLEDIPDEEEDLR